MNIDKEDAPWFFMQKQRKDALIKKKPITAATRPAAVIKQLAVNCKIATLTATLQKHGYKCIIFGQVQYSTDKSRNKAMHKWDLSAKEWFWSNPIETIIADKNTECILVDPTYIKPKNAIEIALQQQQELKKLKQIR